MMNGQKVRIRPASPLARAFNLAPDILGTVICAYSARARGRVEIERVDVRFANNEMVWGGAADQFEIVAADRR